MTSSVPSSIDRTFEAALLDDFFVKAPTAESPEDTVVFCVDPLDTVLELELDVADATAACVCADDDEPEPDEPESDDVLDDLAAIAAASLADTVRYPTILPPIYSGTTAI
jgi:hypothetical protein